jgi:molecular chaperone DnaK
LNYLIEEFKKKEKIDLRNEPLALQRLKEAAEQVKCELSTAFKRYKYLSIENFVCY